MRYEQFGWDYELFNPLWDKEVRWYLDWVRRTGDPVLELACGSGRMLVEFAKAGYDVVGIDLSEKMLGLTEIRIRELPRDVQNRIHFYRYDMVDFNVGREFGMVVIGDNSFRELKTREQQLSCLQFVRKHLNRDGKLLMTERRFDAGLFLDGKREYPWTEAIVHPDTGDMVSRKVEVTLDSDRKWVRGMMTYRMVSDDGTERLKEFRFDAPVMNVEDYLELFQEAGFKTQVYVGYKEKDDDGVDPVLCFVCSKVIQTG